MSNKLTAMVINIPIMNPSFISSSLDDVFPVYFFDDRPNGTKSNMVFMSKFFKSIFPGNIFFSNFFNLLFSEFSFWISFSAIISSTFFYRIKNIVSASTQKKMMRIYTFHYIAFVENIKSIFYFPFVHQIRNSMCPIVNSINNKTAISVVWLRTTCPKPTFAFSSVFELFVKTMNCYRFKFHNLVLNV